MMQVVLEGFSKEEEDLLLEALEFFSKILFHGNMRNRMTFFIQKNTQMELQGECWPEDVANRAFSIDIRCAVDDDAPLETLAHELIHCKQWAKNELAATSTIVARKKPDGVIEVATSFVETWHGEIWKPGRGEHPYFDSPWEVEAYGKALGLIARWNDYQDKKKRKNGNYYDGLASGEPCICSDAQYDTDTVGYCGA